MILAGNNTLVYFGGYTSPTPSKKQEENSKSSYWGTISFCQGPTSRLNVRLRGKTTELGSFACAQAVQLGNDILLSCGTEQKWGVCTAAKARLELCDIPQCSANSNTDTGTMLGYENWIRLDFCQNCYILFPSFNSCLFRCESRCRRWLHYNCAGLKKEDVDAMDTGTKWQCNRTDCMTNVIVQKQTNQSDKPNPKPPLLSIGSFTIPAP